MDRKVTIDLGDANPKQSLFYRSRTLYTAYGGAKGGGKTHAVRVKALGGALRWAGIKILIVRRAYPELRQNHIDPMLKLVPSELATWNGTTNALYFVNGSTIKFGNFQSGAGERVYQGQEYDWIFIDEATQFTEGEFRYLGACLRGVSSAPKRFYLTCNPGGVGHAWVKRLFIDRRFERGENPDDYSFIFASVEDNLPLLRSSPSYISMLESLPDNLMRAYRYGDWDALSGAYFSEFSAERHVIAPISLPRGWTRYRAFDYGLDMLACLWVAVEPNGRSYVYRELKVAGLVVSEAARLMRDMTGETIAITYAPPDMWSRQKDTGRTMAELFAQGGIPIARASSSRVHGHMQIKEALRDMDDGQPALLFFGDCKCTASDLAAIQSDARNPNDCATMPHDATHLVDALRYYCSSRGAAMGASAAVPIAASDSDGGDFGGAGAARWDLGTFLL
ncbi:MAG: phage terminase large subunit [Oscillospiraceae bacterium]|jgi:phage terminase large subunit|nr:phage terminase large subunit [Oscillospiraceae bacterium]